MTRSAALLRTNAPQPAGPAISNLGARAPVIRRSCAACGAGRSGEDKCPACDDPKAIGGVQAKLSIGATDDPFEKEADDVADKVMRMPAGHGAPAIARADGPQGTLRPKPAGPTTPASAGFAAALSRQPGGAPLPTEARGFFEPRFGRDLGHVRIHHGSSAQALAADINARAFTHGADIYFAAGQYNPGSAAGRNLLAHELTHTLQQRRHGVVRRQTEPDSKKSTKSTKPTKSTKSTKSKKATKLGDLDWLEKAKLGWELTKAIWSEAADFTGDLFASMREAPKYMGDVLKDEGKAILENLDSVLRVLTAFLAAETIVGVLTAIPEPTLLTKVAAVLIEELIVGALVYFGAQELDQVVEHLKKWWKLVGDANGDPAKIAEAAKAFCEAILHIVRLVLAVVGVRRAGVKLKTDAIKVKQGLNPGKPIGTKKTTKFVDRGPVRQKGSPTKVTAKQKVLTESKAVSGASKTSAQKTVKSKSSTGKTTPSNSSKTMPKETLALETEIGALKPKFDVKKVVTHVVKYGVPEGLVSADIEAQRLADEDSQTAGETETSIGQIATETVTKKEKPVCKLPEGENVHLMLSGQKAIHKSRYMGLAGKKCRDNPNAGMECLQHSTSRPKRTDQPWREWDREIKKFFGVKSEDKNLYDPKGLYAEGRKMGLCPRQIKRPTWTPQGLYTDTHVDHVVERQVGPLNNPEWMDDAANFELIDSGSNLDSRDEIAKNVKNERLRLVAVTGNPDWMECDLTFTVVDAPTPKRVGRWLFDDVSKGKHLRLFEEMYDPDFISKRQLICE
jgi:hypothetical protein